MRQAAKRSTRFLRFSTSDLRAVRLVSLLPVIALYVPCMSGCGGGMNVARDYSLRNEANTGLVVLSVTFETFSYNKNNQYQYPDDFNAEAEFVYRPIGSDEQRYIDAHTFERLKQSAQQWDRGLYLEGIKGQIFVIELPAGDYEFIRSSVHGAVRASDEMVPHEFSVPFVVKSGKATYLGDLRCSVVANFYPSIGSLPVARWEVRSVTINVKDSYDRDIEFLTNRYCKYSAGPSCEVADSGAGDAI